MDEMRSILAAVRSGHLGNITTDEGYLALAWDGVEVSYDEAVQRAVAWEGRIHDMLKREAALACLKLFHPIGRGH